MVRTSPADQREYLAEDGMDWDDIATYCLFHDMKFQENTNHHLLLISSLLSKIYGAVR
jgi:hypothetical protein